MVWELVQIIPGSGGALPAILAAACGMGSHSEEKKAELFYVRTQMKINSMSSTVLKHTA